MLARVASDALNIGGDGGDNVPPPRYRVQPLLPTPNPHPGTLAGAGDGVVPTVGLAFGGDHWCR